MTKEASMFARENNCWERKITIVGKEKSVRQSISDSGG